MAKKIMFFMPSFGGGGGERIVSDLSLRIPEEVEKTIVVFGGEQHYPYEGKILSLRISLSIHIVAKAIALIKGCLRLRRVIAQERPDVVMSLGSITSIINLLSSKKAVVRLGNPIIQGHERGLERIYPLLVKLFFNRAKKIIVISKGAKNELIEHFGVSEERITVIYNFIDVEKTRALAQQPLPKGYEEIFKHPVIINVANLVEQKGQEHLVRSFALVKREIKDAKLVFIGKGHLEPKLKKMARDLGLQQDIHFLGWQKNPFAFIARSRMFALPSLWEGFGIVILEAMACGVPVVAFDCNFGPKEILAPELEIKRPIRENIYASCGILVPLSSNQENDLAKALTRVMFDQSLCQTIIQSAERRVRDFNAENFLKGYSFLWE